MDLYFCILLLNAIICVYCIFKNSEETFSLHKIVHIFILIFFIAANALQYYTGSNVTSLIIKFTSDDYRHFQIWVFLILLIFNLFYNSIRNRDYSERVVTTYDVSVKKQLMVVLSVVSLALVIYQYHSNLRLMFFRGLLDEITERQLDGSLSLILDKFVRPIPFVCYMISKLTDAHSKLNKLLFILMLVTVCPTGLARNAVAMYWIPVCLVNFPILYKKYIFSGGLLVGLFIIFPFLDSFRYYSGDLITEYSFDYLLTMNFDASQMMMIVQKWDLVTWGKQLLGVIFFFVPRSIWPDKAIGSGHYVADLQGAFSNVSMPFFGEGYINFGVFGVVLFTVLLAIFAAVLDRKFWSVIAEEDDDESKDPDFGLYLIMVGALIFILRGDLLSSFAYTVGTLLSYFVIEKITVKTEEVCE